MTIFGHKRFIQAYGHPAVASQQQVTNGNALALTGHEILAVSFAVRLSSRRATLFEQLNWKPSTKVISRLMAPKFDFCSNPESGLDSDIRPCRFRATTGPDDPETALPRYPGKQAFTVLARMSQRCQTAAVLWTLHHVRNVPQ